VLRVLIRAARTSSFEQKSPAYSWDSVKLRDRLGGKVPPEREDIEMLNKTVVCILLTINFSLLLCQDSLCDNKTLQGIKSVRVKIALSSEEYGINSYQLQNDVELKLRLAGIKVDSNSSQTLSVVVAIMKIEPSASSKVIGCYGTVQITLEEEVHLSRNPGTSTIAPTWQSYIMYLHGGPDNFGKRCRDKVRDFTDAFINDYLSVNPK